MHLQKSDIKSVYVHIPFCKKICSYCDFCKQYYNKNLVFNYLDSLKEEVLKYYKGEVLSTLYVGGGTPSCLDKENLNKLFSCFDSFSFDDNYEFTFECNIEDIDEDLLIFLKSNRVNRLSIGVQSFNKKILDVLGRNYDFSIKDKVYLAKKYFSNINIDLIYGVNGQSLNDLVSDLNKFLSLDVNHISIYSLILEDHTLLKINNYLELDDEANRKMYDYICITLKENNYFHYEISNFSKKGYESKHNLTYWNNNNYYGFGLGASGYIGDVRYTNTRSLNNYMNGNYRLDEEILDKKTSMENFMILGLRMINGVSNKDFIDRYGLNICDVFDTKNLVKDGDYYYIDEDSLYISNYILKDFIDI